MADDFGFFDSRRDLAGMEVLHADFALASTAGAEHPAHDALVPVLRRVREAMGLEIVFVCQLLGRETVVRELPRLRPADTAVAVADPQEAGYGACALQAMRAASAAQACLALPVVSKSGRLFGTVCCPPVSRKGRVESREALRAVARMVALLLDRPAAADSADVWQSSAAAPLGLD
jgi:hypothetical protein